MLAATPPPVPVHVQQLIALHAPELAYVPARIPTGYRYLKWNWSQEEGAVRIWFHNKAGKQVVFVSAWLYGGCQSGKEKTFQLAGNKVYWGEQVVGQQAWRCVRGGPGVVIQLTAETSQSPTKFADVGLGRVAASAHLVHLR